jgi:hypothetical protein
MQLMQKFRLLFNYNPIWQAPVVALYFYFATTGNIQRNVLFCWY